MSDSLRLAAEGVAAGRTGDGSCAMGSAICYHFIRQYQANEKPSILIA